MNSKDYFKDIYEDFFKVEENDIKDTDSDSQIEMNDIFSKINSLYIDDESRDTLKKIIEYMRKYKEKIEKNYIPFHIVIEANNDEVINSINDILYDSSKYFSYIDDNKKSNISLYKMDKDVDYLASYISINGLNGINLLSDNIKKKIFYELEEELKSDLKKIIVISGKSEEVTNFFLGNENVRNKYFDFCIRGISPSANDILEYVKENTDISDKMQVELLDYITETYNNDIDYVSYQKDLVKYISFNKSIPHVDKVKSIDEVFKELNELVGLDKVKKVLYELVDVINLKEKAGDSLKIKDINLHMVFLGNPGTGKTTIARMVSSILYNLKFIKEDKLIEVSAKDLVAEYVGQTAPRTMSVIEKSMNGVLFIDEAYSLAYHDDNSFNDEAIATLIQAMENYRDRLVVIFAGYTKEMQDFLNSNSGIVSRIGYTLEFDDYTTDELIKIFVNFMTKAGFVVKEDALSYLREIIDKNRDMKNFGNARFVRNIYEKTIIKHASNTKDKKRRDVLKTITKNDISIDNLILKEEE